MKKDRWLLRTAGLLLLSAVLMTTFSLAAEAGAAGDPLVTLSYLNETFFNSIMQRVDQKIAERTGGTVQPPSSSGGNEVFAPDGGIIVVGGLEDGGAGSSVSSGSSGGETTATETNAAENFIVVTLQQGQTLTGGIGCEVMLRVGSAVCVSAASPGLIDETQGTTLDGGGALSQNHLYMMTIEGRGVQAPASEAKLLVRGSYTVS